MSMYYVFIIALPTILALGGKRLHREIALFATVLGLFFCDPALWGSPTLPRRCARCTPFTDKWIVVPAHQHICTRVRIPKSAVRRSPCAAVGALPRSFAQVASQARLASRDTHRVAKSAIRVGFSGLSATPALMLPPPAREPDTLAGRSRRPPYGRVASASLRDRRPRSRPRQIAVV